MLRARSVTGWRFLLALVAIAGALQAVGSAQNGQQPPRLHPRRIAVFGSSVANGRGDETLHDGYAGLLRVVMAQRGWEVVEQSRNGDDTARLAARFAPVGAPDPKVRYLMTVNPSYVVIGLSFGNEGLVEAKTKAQKDVVYDRYLAAIKGFVDRARQNGVVPVVALAYPRMSNAPDDYAYIKRANIEQATWDVATVNLLGAGDDGNGRWVFDFDDKHPQASGHREMFYAFVPSMFEALEKGKPSPSRAVNATGFMRVTAGVAPLTFAPDETMHPFAVSMMVRAQRDGTIAAISGSTLLTKTETRQGEGKDFPAITLYTDKPFTASLGVQNGKWTYKSPAGAINSGVSADTQWHQIVLSHFTARGETLLYVDGKLAGRVGERLEPNRFVIGGPGTSGAAAAPRQADYKDLLIYRAGLNAEEVAALNQGVLLHGSLDIYSPLNGAGFTAGSTVDNLAQSLDGMKIGTDRIAHVDEGASTK
jgi:lysophospholipase L1-like esterase